MPQFSQRSAQQLASLHPKLQSLLMEAIKYVDFTVLEGYRGEEAQNQAFEHGKSLLRFPDGKHNRNPSEAVDIAPFPIDWSDTKRFVRVLSFIQGLAAGMGIKVRLGLDWDGDFVFNEKFTDYPHIELVDEKA